MSKLQPLDVLRRMCDAIILRKDTVAFMDDVQLFWRRSWVIQEVPDPKEQDPLRYALMACFLERMAEVWSAPPKNTLSIPPKWCESVPPIKEKFSVLPDEFWMLFEVSPASPIFKKRNIFALQNYMFFL